MSSHCTCDLEEVNRDAICVLHRLCRDLDRGSSSTSIRRKKTNRRGISCGCMVPTNGSAWKAEGILRTCMAGCCSSQMIDQDLMFESNLDSVDAMFFSHRNKLFFFCREHHRNLLDWEVMDRISPSDSHDIICQAIHRTGHKEELGTFLGLHHFRRVHVV